MWFLLGLLWGRRSRRPHRSEPGVSLLLFALAVVGVLIGGFWLGVAFAAGGIAGLAIAAGVAAHNDRNRKEA